MKVTPILQIIATSAGVREVCLVASDSRGARLYEALLPAIDLINGAIRETARERPREPVEVDEASCARR